MVSGTHPDELQLLDYVEGDLDDAAQAVVEAHVDGCSECAGRVRLLEGARDALREAPLLEAPDRVRPDLPEREPARRPFRRGRIALVLASLAAVAALAAVVATQDGPRTESQGGEGGGQVAAQAEEGAGQTGADDAAGGRTTYEAAPVAGEIPVRSVAGPAREVVQLLEDEGLEARRANDRVEVRGATPRQVEVALGDRPAGPVEVVAVP